MKNLAKIFLASSLCCASAFAGSSFVGIEGGYSFKNEIEDVSDKTPSIGIKGGYDFGDFRAYAKYGYDFKAKEKYSEVIAGNLIEGVAEVTRHTFVFGADYTPKLSENFKFLVGGFIGSAVLNVESKAQGGGVSEEIKDSGYGIVGGVRAGGILTFDEHNEFEIGVKADWAAYTGFDYLEDASGTNLGAFVGYNYKF